MKITIEPTPEIWSGTINGVSVPFRIWKGRTEGGVEIEAYVFSITPNRAEDTVKLKLELPDFMRPSRTVAKIMDWEKE